jgi:hypothetical protein
MTSVRPCAGSRWGSAVTVRSSASLARTATAIKGLGNDRADFADSNAATVWSLTCDVGAPGRTRTCNLLVVSDREAKVIVSSELRDLSRYPANALSRYGHIHTRATSVRCRSGRSLSLGESQPMALPRGSGAYGTCQEKPHRVWLNCPPLPKPKAVEGATRYTRASPPRMVSPRPNQVPSGGEPQLRRQLLPGRV